MRPDLPFVSVLTAERKARDPSAAQGCNGGSYEFDRDDNHYEIDDARCGDGKRYDFKLDRSFSIIDRDLED